MGRRHARSDHTGKGLGQAPLYYVAAAGRWYVAASFAGSDHPPQWYFNLLATPAVGVDVKGGHTTCTARVLPADEASLVWPRLVAFYPLPGTDNTRIPVIELSGAGEAPQAAI